MPSTPYRYTQTGGVDHRPSTHGASARPIGLPACTVPRPTLHPRPRRLLRTNATYPALPVGPLVRGPGHQPCLGREERLSVDFSGATLLVGACSSQPRPQEQVAATARPAHGHDVVLWVLHKGPCLAVYGRYPSWYSISRLTAALCFIDIVKDEREVFRPARTAYGVRCSRQVSAPPEARAQFPRLVCG